MIADTVVGLQTFDESKVDEKKMIEYCLFTESHNNPKLSIWACISAIFLMAINIIGKQVKNAYVEEYQIRKVVESYFSMKAIHWDSVSESNI